MANTPAAIPKPHFSELNIVEKRLLGPGPSNLALETRNALASPMLGYLHTEFTEIMDEVKMGIKYVFQTRNPLTFAVSGSGHSGMECAFMNLLEPGESVLVVKNGIWGQRIMNLSKRLGLNAIELAVPEGQIVPLKDIQRAIETHKPSLLFVCHGESSTGVLHPLEGLGQICRDNNCLFLVDTVASLGAAPFKADELMVDCVYTATQKVLNCPPGLAPISFSDRAVKKILQRKTPVVSFYFDALEIGNYWGCFEAPRRYHHTAPISTVYGLQKALSLITNEGIDESINRHLENVKYLHKLLEESGFELFVSKPENRLPCLTTVCVPEGVDWKAVQDDLMSQRLEISGGLGATAGKIWRIGTFGINSDQRIIDDMIERLKESASKHCQDMSKTSHLKAAV